MHTVDALAATLSAHPDDPLRWRDAARQLLERGLPDAAYPIAHRALELQPNVSNALGLADAAAQTGRSEHALDLIASAVEAGVEDATDWTHLARIFRLLGEHDDALVCHREAARRADGPREHARLIDALEKLGADEEAHERLVAYEKRWPQRAEGLHLRMRFEHHRGQLERARSAGEELLRQGNASPSIHLELARICLKSGDGPAVLRHATRGNHLALEKWGGDPEAYPRQLRHLLEPPLSPLPTQTVEAPPAFLVGFPRSGTTLLQQMLDRHPGLRTADEEPYLDQALQDVLPGLTTRQRIDRMTPDLAARIREAYRRRAGDGPLLDKQPLNLGRVDLLARVFPGAPIVVLHRDPRASVVSAFLQDFVMTDAMASFTCLERAARTYDLLLRVWARAKADVDALEVHYEALVADPEPVLREVLTHLGLPWDPTVLHAREGTARTPSYRDIRQGLYRHERWRTIEDALQEALPHLYDHLAYSWTGSTSMSTRSSPEDCRGPQSTSHARRCEKSPV